MLKIAGIIIIMISTTLYGYRMSLDLKAEYNELLEIKKMMFLLKGEIAYGSCTINEALANISTRCGMNIDNILENIASDTEGNFYENWEQKWNDGFLNMHLSKNIKADILNFKDVLGLADKSGELSQIDLFLSRLQNEIDNTEIGLWMAKVREVYNNFRARNDIFCHKSAECTDVWQWVQVLFYR